MLFALMRSSFIRHNYDFDKVLRHIFNHMILSHDFDIIKFFVEIVNDINNIHFIKQFLYNFDLSENY